MNNASKKHTTLKMETWRQKSVYIELTFEILNDNILEIKACKLNRFV